MGRKCIDLTGHRFGRLTVIERAENDKHGQPQWLCKCICGNTAVVNGGKLRRGDTRSCGCLVSETTTQRSRKHGCSNTRVYHIYRSMKDRCNNPNCKSYSYYGGRGINVCSEWENSFETFYKWAMANGYDDTLTLDRIDNDNGYSSNNCRWVTQAKQIRNRRCTRYLEYNGKKQTISEWAREIGVSTNTLYQRFKYGWSIEKALTTPVREQTPRSKKKN